MAVGRPRGQRNAFLRAARVRDSTAVLVNLFGVLRRDPRQPGGLCDIGLPPPAVWVGEDRACPPCPRFVWSGGVAGRALRGVPKGGLGYGRSIHDHVQIRIKTALTQSSPGTPGCRAGTPRWYIPPIVSGSKTGWEIHVVAFKTLRPVQTVAVSCNRYPRERQLRERQRIHSDAPPSLPRRRPRAGSGCAGEAAGKPPLYQGVHSQVCNKSTPRPLS